MVAVVEPDRDDLADPGDRHAVARRSLDHRQRCDIGGERLRQRRDRQVGDHAREVAERTVGVDDTGLFLAGLAIAAELHETVFRYQCV